MAPEQIRGTPAVSHKTDLYSLGVVLYQMLDRQAAVRGGVGRRPDALPPERAAAAAQRQGRRRSPGRSTTWCVALMAKAPADRPWDAAAVGVVLTELRDKAERGERDRDGLADPRLARRQPAPRRRPPGRRAGRSPRPKKKARKATILSTLTGSFFATRSRSTRDEAGRAPARAAGLETLLLVGALLGDRRPDRLPGLAPGPGVPLPAGRGADGLDTPLRLDHRPRRIPRAARPPVPESPLSRADDAGGATRSCSTRPMAAPAYLTAPVGHRAQSSPRPTPSASS